MARDRAEHYAQRVTEPDALRSALNWYRAAARSLLRATSTPIEVPTLYVWGTADGALGGRAARATEQHVNGPYRFEMLWDASHWLPEDEADKVAELLLDHLEAFAESSST